MDLLHSIGLGFQVAIQPINLLYCFIGVLLGTIVGVLPGIGPASGMALLLPVTIHVPPISSIILLAGIYYGTMYGGSITSILMNIPGEAASVITCIDGYQMARQGRAGPALGISAFGSFIAGTSGVLILMAIANPLARAALKFGPPEYFSLMILGLCILIYLAQKSFIKAVIMATIGLLIGYIGLDLVSGQVRFTFKINRLVEGVNIIPIVMGLFGVSEILDNLEVTETRSIFKTHIKKILPTLKDWADSIWAIIRGTIMGFFLGMLPGGGAILSSFASYAVEKRISKHPEKFGKGAIEGVAGPEAANNAASIGAFVPLMALGIPSNVIMAMLYGGLLIHGLQPGPLLIKEHPDFFWGVISSMYIGNIMLLILNVPLIGIWVQILKIPFRFFFPAITLFLVIGVYSVNNSLFDIGVMIIFGIAGYILKKCDYEPAPFILGFIVGPMLEQSMRQSLTISNGSFAVFLLRPISVTCLIISALILMISLMPNIRRKMVGSLNR